MIDSDSDGEQLEADDGLAPEAAGAAAGPGGWQFEPVAKAAEEFEALMAAGGFEDAVDAAAVGGSGGKASGKSGGKGKVSSKGKVSKRGRSSEAVVLDGSCDGELAPAGGAAGPAEAAVAAERDAELWDGTGYGDDADMPPDGAYQAAAAGAPPLGSQQPASQQLPEQQQQQDQPAVQHQLLFPEASGAVLRWDGAGRLAIAPPPTLDTLLAAVGAPAAAPNLSQSSGGASQGADAAPPAAEGEPPAVPVSTPPPSQQQPVLPPLLAEDGLVLQRRAQPGGPVQRDLIRFDDAAAHRWAFLAAAGAGQAGTQEAAPAAGAAQVAPTAPQAQAAAEAAQVAAAPAAGKKSGKVSKPRKRKPAAAAAAAAAGEPPAGAAADAAGAQAKKRKVRQVVMLGTVGLQDRPAGVVWPRH